MLKSYRDNLSTFFQNCQIKIGETYTSRLIKSYHVEIGLHSFKHLKDIRIYLDRSYPDRKCGYSEIKVARCIIPAGSKYWKGEFKDSGESYASSCIKYIELIDNI